MTTYSQSVVGINANACYNTAKTIQVGDTDAAGNAACNSAGAEQGSGMRGNRILCKNPDGSLTWYTIDAERSIPGVSLVMRAV